MKNQHLPDTDEAQGMSNEMIVYQHDDLITLGYEITEGILSMCMLIGYWCRDIFVACKTKLITKASC